MNSLEDIFQQYDVPYKTAGEHHHTTRGWVSTDCPHCSPNWGHYRLGFEIGTWRVNCWVCGILNKVETLSLVCEISTGEAAEICKSLSSDIPEYTVKPRGKLILPDGIGPLLDCHENYLAKRGFNPDKIAQLWGVQGIGLADRLQYRLFIPIHSKEGRIVSWTTRAIDDQAENKYMTASPPEEEISSKDVLYGAHLAQHVAVIVEGPLDAWKIGPGAVASCGVGFSKTQMFLMSQYPVRIVCFDSDEAGQEKADKLCRELSMFDGNTENVIFETGDDPASANDEEVEEFRKEFLTYH